VSVLLPSQKVSLPAVLLPSQKVSLPAVLRVVEQEMEMVVPQEPVALLQLVV
jgi:hypothetical protein